MVIFLVLVALPISSILHNPNVPSLHLSVVNADAEGGGGGGEGDAGDGPGDGNGGFGDQGTGGVGGPSANGDTQGSDGGGDTVYYYDCDAGAWSYAGPGTSPPSGAVTDPSACPGAGGASAPPPPPTPVYSLSISKTELSPGKDATVYPGDTIKYRMYIANTGDAQGDLTVVDDIPMYTTFLWQGGGTTNSVGAANSGGVQNGAVWWIQTPNPVGWSGYVDFNVTVNSDAPDGAQICNTAQEYSEHVATQNSNTVCNTVSNGTSLTVPPPVASISYSCSADGTSVTLSWPSSSGATGYYPRVWVFSGSCPVGWTMWTDGHTCFIDAYNGLSAQFKTTPGVVHNAWVYPGNAVGVNWNNPPDTGGFSCKVPAACVATKGDPCESVANNCSETNTGTIQCDGTCSAARPADKSSCTSITSCTGSNCEAPPSGCNIAASPKSTTAGSSVLLGWTSVCASVAAGCTQSVLGIPVSIVAGNTKIDQGVGDVKPSSGTSPIVVTPLSLPITYTLTGKLYWPLLIPVSGSDYSCSVTVNSEAKLCPDGSMPVGGVCPVNACAKTGYPRCSADALSFQYLDKACAVQTSACRYASVGYGCAGGECLTPPSPTATFTIQPTLVRFGSTVHITLKALDVTRCSITSAASSLDSRTLTGSLGNGWRVSDNYQSTPMTGQTIFTLHCDGVLDNTSVDKAVTVNLVPKFLEQ